MGICVCLLPSSGVVRLDLKSSSSPLSSIRLSAQPAGLQALTVTVYRVDGVRPVITPGEEHEHAREDVRQGEQTRNFTFSAACENANL